MTTTLIVDAETEGLLDLLVDSASMRTREFIRGARAVVTIADLVEVTGLVRGVVQRQVDDLVAHGLLRQVRAHKPRRAIGRVVHELDPPLDGASHGRRRRHARRAPLQSVDHHPA